MIEFLGIWAMLSICTIIMFVICYRKDILEGYKQIYWLFKALFIIIILPIYPIVILVNIIAAIFKKGS